MGYKWKRRRPATDTGIDLLSTVFGVPSRRDIERADRKLAIRHVYRFNNSLDDSIDGEIEDKSGNNCVRACTLGKNTLLKDGPSSLTEISTSRPSPEKLRQSRCSVSPAVRQLNKPTKSCESLLVDEPKCKGHNSRDNTMPSGRTKKTSKTRPRNFASGPAKSHQIQQTDERNYSSYVPLSFINNICHNPQTTPNGCLTFTFAHPHFMTQGPRYEPLSVDKPAQPPLSQVRNKHGQGIPSSPPDSPTHRLRSLQRHLDHAQEQLSHKPYDLQLQHKRRNAQHRLNELLEIMVAGKSAKSKEMPTASVTEVLEKAQLVVDDDLKENKAPADEPTQTATMTLFPPQRQGDQALNSAALNNVGSSTIRHHLCSGCGELRSRRFHQKCPIVSSHKPILNYCSICRQTRLEKNTLDHHHFCFGCGRVRSKVFQEKYKAKPGIPLLPNYCGKCTDEVRLIGDINETSVLGAVLRAPTHNNGTESDGNTITSPTATTDKSVLHYLQNQSHQKSLIMKKRTLTRLNNLSPVRNTSAPVSPAESTPYFPGRRLGSAQRRAQRALTPHPTEETVAASGNPAGSHEYHAPYVEEVLSNIGLGDGQASNCGGTTALRSDNDMKHEANHVPKGSDENSIKTGHHRLTPTETQNVLFFNDEESEERLARCHRRRRANHSTPRFRSNQVLAELHNGNPADESDCTMSTIDPGKGIALDEVGSGSSNDQKSRRQSPLAQSGSFDPLEGDHFHEDYQQDNVHKVETPRFASSRGAFGLKKSSFSMFDYSNAGLDGSASKRSSTMNNYHRLDRHYTTDTNANTFADMNEEGSGHSSYSFRSTSERASSTHSQPAMDNTYSRSVFTDYSRSTNPYYKPRRCRFPNVTESNFRASKEWHKGERPPDAPKAYGNTSVDDRIPEPIIEEPVSPPSTPIQRTMLLEFKKFDTKDSVSLRG